MSTEQLRTRIAALEAEIKNARGLHKQLETAQNELALKTAEAFVVVDDGTRIVICGASSETVSRAMRLHIISVDWVVEVWQNLSTGGKVSIRLVAGGQVSFSVADDELEEEKNYIVRVFDSPTSAEKWAAGRRRENSSR